MYYRDLIIFRSDWIAKQFKSVDIKMTRARVYCLPRFFLENKNIIYIMNIGKSHNNGNF